MDSTYPQLCRIKSCILLFFALLFLSIKAYASFTRGLEHYENGDFEEAYFIFKNMAAVGDKSSQFNLGVMYYRGEYVERDIAMAYAWMTLASESGDSKFGATANKLFSKLDEKGKSAAAQQIKKLEKTYGDKAIQQALVPKPLSDEDCEKELLWKVKKLPEPVYPRDALKKHRMTVGFVELIFNISPEGYPRDITLGSKTNEVFVEATVKAVSHATWALKEKDSKPAMQFNYWYRVTYMDAGRSKKAVKNIIDKSTDVLTLAEKGDIVAQYKYAKTLATIKILDPTEDKLDLEYSAANEWLLRAAQQGHPLAQYDLGNNMIAGRGCEADENSGLKWLRAAASSGHPFAQENLAMSELRAGLSDEHRTVYWLRKAASSDHYKGKLFLAWHLATTGNPDIFSPVEARSLLKSEPSMYYDKVRIEETHAAVFAANKNFKAAIEWQAKALKTAKKLGWKIPAMKRRLESYKNGHRWIGAYHI